MFSSHTDSDHWKDVPYDKERGLWHGQPVEFWDCYMTHRRYRGFYDAIRKTVFDYEGMLRKSDEWDNMKAIPSDEYKPWMMEGYTTLEGI